MKTIITGLLSLAAATVVLGSPIPADTFIDFETGNEGQVVTGAIMTNATKGNLFLGWKTSPDPESRTDGPTPNLTITTNASFSMPGSVTIAGTNYFGVGTRGLRATLAANNAVQLSFAAPGYPIVSIGFYFRFNGPKINWAPRDVVDFFTQAGYFQIMQIYDQASSPPGDIPYVHAHDQFGAGVGNDINFARNKWYWVTERVVSSGLNHEVRFYDPANNYALVGTSTNAVGSGQDGFRTLTFGCNKYSAGSAQTIDYDNFVINVGGIFPLLPDGTGVLPAAPSNLKVTTP